MTSFFNHFSNEELRQIPDSIIKDMKTLQEGHTHLSYSIIQRELLKSQPNLLILEAALCSPSAQIRKISLQTMICSKTLLPQQFVIEKLIPSLQSKQITVPVVQCYIQSYVQSQQLKLLYNQQFLCSEDLQMGLGLYYLNKYYNQLEKVGPGSYPFIVNLELKIFLSQYDIFQCINSLEIKLPPSILFILFEIAEEKQIQLSNEKISQIINNSSLDCRSDLIYKSICIIKDIDQFIIFYQDEIQQNLKIQNLPILSSFVINVVNMNECYVNENINVFIENYQQFKFSIKYKVGQLLIQESMDIIKHQNLQIPQKFEDITQLDVFNSEFTDETFLQILIIAQNISITQQNFDYLCVKCQHINGSTQFIGNIYSLIITLSAKFNCSDSFLDIYKQILVFCQKYPAQQSIFLNLNLCYYNQQNLSIYLSALLTIPNQHSDCQFYELNTLRLLQNEEDLPEIDVVARIYLVKKILGLDNPTIVNDLFTLLSDKTSLLYSQDKTFIFEDIKTRLSTDSNIFKKQIQIAFLIDKLCERHPSINKTQQILSLINKKTNKSAKYCLERAISYFYINQNTLFLDQPQITFKTTFLLTSAFIINNSTISIPQDFINKIIGFSFSQNSEIRFLAIFLLKIIDKTRDSIDASIQQAISCIKVPDFSTLSSLKLPVFIEKQPEINSKMLNPTEFHNYQQLFDSQQKLEETIQFLQKVKPVTFSSQTQQKIDVNVQKFTFIPVCSLLDNEINLGGICRTSEIFGAEKLIVQHISQVSDKSFLNSAVTAQEHIEIDEVRIDELEEFIAQLKSQGYTVIALEQCSNSTKLSEFKFDQKCAVILGNETTGCPDRILKLCDKFVEIEQFGVVRSLNVHVSYSLLIWEYVKQWK